MSDYTLVLADGSTIQADVDGEISKWVRDLLESGRKVRVRSDGKDVSGHAMSDTVGVIIYGDDDTEGHALTLRLPNTEAARDLQKKLLATGALVGVIVAGVGVAQVAPNLSIGQSSDAGASAVSRSIGWDEAHGQGRAAPSVAGTQAGDFDAAHHTAPGVAAATGSTWDLTHDGPGVAPGAAATGSTWDLTHDGPGAVVENAGTSAVIGGAVDPGQTRDHLRTGSTPIVPPASANPLVRDGEADMAPIGSAAVAPPASANPLVRDGQADNAPVGSAAVGTSAVAGNDARHDVGATVSASTVDPTGGTIRGYDAAAVPTSDSAVQPTAARDASVADHGTTNEALFGTSSAAAQDMTGYGGGAARDAWVADHGTTNEALFGTSSAAAQDIAAGGAARDASVADHGTTNEALFGTSSAGAQDIAAGGAARDASVADHGTTNEALFGTSSAGAQAGDTDRAYAVHAAGTSISGKAADDAALATGAVSGKEIDDTAIASSAMAGKEIDDTAIATSTSQSAGKDVDDQTLATSGSDDRVEPARTGEQLPRALIRAPHLTPHGEDAARSRTGRRRRVRIACRIPGSRSTSVGRQSTMSSPTIPAAAWPGYVQTIG